jgi:hypothetical protein
MPGSWRASDFPNLTNQNCEIKSPRTNRYNCIAWAAGNDTHWWWPDGRGIGYWPQNVPREETLEAFIRAFATIGYHVCDNAALEAGFEKIAIYAERVGTILVPTHSALQLPDGRWTSKLGPFEDIQHRTLSDLDGPAYARAVAYLKR